MYSCAHRLVAIRNAGRSSPKVRTTTSATSPDSCAAVSQP